MSGRRIESKIETLTEEQRKEFEQRLEEEKPTLIEDLVSDHQEAIKNQILNDRDELNNFNVIVSGFQDRDGTEYTFIRTEPFIHENKKNFDLLIANQEKGIAVLVEYERTLARRTDAKVEKFGKRKAYVENGGDTDLDTDEYLSDVLATGVEAIDFVLSSQHTPQDRLRGAAQRKGLNFCVWDLADHGARCSIYCYNVKESKTAAFAGHTDSALEKHIIDVLAGRVLKQDYLAFTFSSSNYLKLKHMAFVLVTRYHEKGHDTFTYQDWVHLFGVEDMELNNYIEQEKQTLYQNFIKYGQACNVVELEENHGKILENEYRVVSRAKSNGKKLEAELEEKMAKHEMAADKEERLRELKNQLLEEVESTDTTTLDEFFDIG